MDEAVKKYFKKNKIVSVLFIMVLVFILQSVDVKASDDNVRGPYEVLEVLSGDTISVLINGQSELVRLIGINAPEWHDCHAEESKEYASKLLSNQNIWLEIDSTQGIRESGSKHRLLAYIILLNGDNYNYLAVESGNAEEFTYNVPYVHQQKFKEAQFSAEANNIGLWADVCSDNAEKNTVADILYSPMVNIGGRNLSYFVVLYTCLILIAVSAAWYFGGRKSMWWVAVALNIEILIFIISKSNPIYFIELLNLILVAILSFKVSPADEKLRALIIRDHEKSKVLEDEKKRVGVLEESELKNKQDIIILEELLNGSDNEVGKLAEETEIRKTLVQESDAKVQQLKNQLKTRSSKRIGTIKEYVVADFPALEFSDKALKALSKHKIEERLLKLLRDIHDEGKKSVAILSAKKIVNPAKRFGYESVYEYRFSKKERVFVHFERDRIIICEIDYLHKY